MNNLKIKFLALMLPLLFINIVSADVIQNPLSSTFQDIPSIVNWATGYILPVSTLALVGIVIYAGFLKLTSIGNPDKEKMVMQTLQSGIVGFVLILSASLVVTIIGAALGIRLLGLAS